MNPQDERLAELLLKKDDFTTLCICQELMFYNTYKAFLSASLKDFVRHSLTVTDKVRARTMTPRLLCRVGAPC